MNLVDIAKVAHELNKAYCESLGDFSQPEWKDAPEWQKSSAVNGVAFHLENPDATPSASHESWLKQKTEEGWKYGPVKNPSIKEHPCFLPYEQLPAEQKAKDFIFRQTIHSLKYFYLEAEKREKEGLSFGQKAVGLNFNPSGDDAIGRINQKFADAIDQLNSLRESTGSREIERMCSVAITEAQTSQMWAVKAITWRD